MYKDIKALLRAIFYGKPIIGKVYIFDEWDNDVNPFQSPIELQKVKVLDVKRGYVKYQILKQRYFCCDDSMKINAFHFCYKEVLDEK